MKRRKFISNLIIKGDSSMQYLDDDLYDLQVRYPMAIYSHDTAMMLHELTTFSPFVYHLTFPKDCFLENLK